MTERPLIYISGPITNGGTASTREIETNIANAQSVAVDLIRAGFAVYCPHSSGLWQREKDVAYDEWLEHDFSVIDRCDAVYRLPGESRGADAEVEYATDEEIPVFHAGGQSYSQLLETVRACVLEKEHRKALRAERPYEPPPSLPSAESPSPPGIVTYASGAVRSGDRKGLRYSLIPYEGMKRRAAANGEGEIKYGTFNWQKGMPVSELLDHALAHIYLYASGDTSEDHLGHAGWNLDAACWMEVHRPECVDIGPLAKSGGNQLAASLAEAAVA